MILFLKRREQKGALPPSDSIAAYTQWGPASGWGGMKVSTVWLEDRKAYCFQQWDNPGPSTLSECWRLPSVGMSSDVAVFTSRIQEVLEVQRDLAETLVLNHAEVRAERLGRIALGDVYVAQLEAMDALGKSGTVALPEVFQIMDKPAAFYDGEKLIRMLVEAAGKDSGKQLHGRLRQDLIYWKTVGPKLTQNWLGQLITVGSPLFMKLNETKLIVQELDQEHYAPAAQTAAELRDFWVSQPQLYNPKWGERDPRKGGTALEMIRAESYELAKECDDFTKHVGVEKTAR